MFVYLLKMRLSYRQTKTRLDIFLHGVLGQSYNELWSFSKKLLLLSHGQATVERGFSINKEVETCNMQEETMVSHRLICNYVSICGGLLNVPISKELLASAASAISGSAEENENLWCLGTEARSFTRSHRRPEKKNREFWSRYLRACRRMLISLQKKMKEKLAPWWHSSLQNQTRWGSNIKKKQMN